MNWLHFPFLVKTADLKLKISKFYYEIISIQAGIYISDRPLTE